MVARVRDIIQRGTTAAKPAATAVDVGTLYFDTDLDALYRSNGTTWESVEAAAAAGAVANDAIWDAAGDLAVGTGANTAARLAVGAANTVPKSNGTTLAYTFPPGHEFDYVESTVGTLSPTATTEATAEVIVTGNSVTYDGSTAVIIEAFSPLWSPPASSGAAVVLVLWDDTAAASIGKMGYHSSQAASRAYEPMTGKRRLTPAAGARIYSLRAYGNGAEIFRGPGGVGEYMPAFIRITKA